MKDTNYISPGIQQGEDLTAKLLALTLELEQLNKKLLDSENARMRILENISHDLRAPLAAVRSAVERLSSDNISKAEQQNLVGIMDKRIGTLERLVDELYLSQKLNQPEFTPNFELLPIAAFLEEYYVQLDVSGKMQGRKLTLSLPSETSAAVNLDSYLFVRVLDNLISNAYRHTQNNDKIEFALSEIQGASVVLSIGNSGACINSEHLPHIFERTFTASSARTPDKTGSGLGLFIAKAIVEKHGGTIICENSQNTGVIFKITLPIAKAL